MFYVAKLMNNGYGDTQEGLWEDKEVDEAVIRKVWAMDFASDMEEDDLIDQFGWNVVSKDEGAENLAKLIADGFVVTELEEVIVGVGVDRAQVIEQVLRKV